MIKDVDLDRALIARTSEHRALIVFSLTDCPPCSVLEKALVSLLNDGKLDDWLVLRHKVKKSDKKAVGKVVLAGVSSFPTLKVVQDCVVTNSFRSVPSDWDAGKLGAFLMDKLPVLGPVNKEASSSG